MAIPADTKFKTEGSMDVESIEMTIDPDGFEFLMSILTNLYEYPARAVIREYSTNAIDAHIEAGYDGPVEITSPSAFSPEFVVRDFGVGMSYEDIRDTYSKYVASTKRNSNSQAGMFGIGSKSALAYGDRFTVESVKNGERIVCLISRVGRGAAKIEIMSRSKTSDSSGTTVRVPAKRVHDFSSEIPEFYQYVKKGKFLVDGVDMGETFEGVKVSDDLYAVKGTGYYNSRSVIVMGNVPYKVDMPGYLCFVKYVNIGDFEPTPPREALEQDASFTGKMEAIKSEIRLKMASSATNEIKDKSPDEVAKYLSERISVFSAWSATGDIKFDGKGILEPRSQDNVIRIQSSSRFYGDGSMPYTMLDEISGIHVTGYTGDENLTTYTTAKAYSARGVRSGENVYLWLNDEKPEFAPEGATIEWSELSEVSSSKTTPASGSGHSTQHKAGEDWKVPTRLPMFDGYASKPASYASKYYTEVVPNDRYDSSEMELVYFSSSDVTSRMVHNSLERLMKDKRVFLVIKNRNQFDKTVRDYPEAKNVLEYMKDKAAAILEENGQEAFVNRATADVHLYSKLKGDLFNGLKKYDKSLTISASDAELVRHYHHKGLTAQSGYDKMIQEIETAYPLLQIPPSGYYGRNSSITIETNQRYIDAIDNYKE